MCVSWRQSRRCTLTLSCRWGTAKIFEEQRSQKKGRWENAFCKGHANMMALLGLSDVQLSLFASAYLCRTILQAVNGSWLLVSIGAPGVTFKIYQIAGVWVGAGGWGAYRRERWASLFGVASPWFLGKECPLFSSFFPKVCLLKGVLNRVVKTLRQYG